VEGRSGRAKRRGGGGGGRRTFGAAVGVEAGPEFSSESVLIIGCEVDEFGWHIGGGRSGSARGDGGVGGRECAPATCTAWGFRAGRGCFEGCGAGGLHAGDVAPLIVVGGEDGVGEEGGV